MYSTNPGLTAGICCLRAYFAAYPIRSFISQVVYNILIKFISAYNGGKPYFACLIVEAKLIGHLNGE